MKIIYRDLFFGAFLLFIVAVIITANRGALGTTFEFVYQIPHFDKLGHFILMGTLAFLAILSLVPRMKGPQKRATFKIVMIFLVIIALEEVSQHFIVLLASFVSQCFPLKKTSR